MKEQFKISDQRLVNVLIRMYEFYEQRSDADDYCAHNDVVVPFRHRSLDDLCELYERLYGQANDSLIKEEGLSLASFSRRSDIQMEMRAFAHVSSEDDAFMSREVIGDYLTREAMYLNPLVTVLFYNIDYHHFKQRFIDQLQDLIDRLVSIDARYYTHRFRKVLDAFLYSLDNIVNKSYSEEYDLLFDRFSSETQYGFQTSVKFFKTIHRLNSLRPHIDTLRESLCRTGEMEFRSLLRKLVQEKYEESEASDSLFYTFPFVVLEQFHEALYLKAMKIFNDDTSHSYRIRKKEADILYEHEFFVEGGSDFNYNYGFLDAMIQKCELSYLAMKDVLVAENEELALLEKEDYDRFQLVIMRETLSALLLSDRLNTIASLHGISSLHDCARHFYFLYKEYILQDAAHPENCNGFTESVGLNSASGALGELLSQMYHSQDEFYIVLMCAFAREYVKYPRRPRIAKNIERGFALRAEGNIFALSFYKSTLPELGDS